MKSPTALEPWDEDPEGLSGLVRSRMIFVCDKRPYDKCFCDKVKTRIDWKAMQK